MPNDSPTTPTVRLSGQLVFPPVTPRPGPIVGELLAGRYRLGRSVGAGGMGEVFEAEQLAPVRRTVAIKLVRDDGDDIAPRLEAERQALARMSHPHIAAVFDAGTAPDGRPFVVMEFVRGVSLAQYVAGNRLPVRERVDLLRQVCLAVQHAHAKGVIHRDLKPSNVMVERTDAGPVPKVIDFGLAKALQKPLTADPNLTAAGTVLGTPLYMAPEQTDPAADVDTRADVFALGGILYELLAGVTPLDPFKLLTAGAAEQLRLIRASTPPPPSERAKDPSVVRQARGDLDAVTLKALARDPADRYETAAALADDLRRWLADEPVSAGRTTARLRVRRFVRRNRAAVAATTAVLLALVAGVAGTSVMLVRARAAETNLRTVLGQVTDEQRQTAAALAQVGSEQEATGKALTQVKAEKTAADAAREQTRKALAAATDISITSLVSHAPTLTAAERQQLHTLADLIGGLDGAIPGGEQARMQLRVALLYERLGDHDRAAAQYRRAVATADRVADPGLAGQARVKLARHALGAGRPAGAEAPFRQAVALLTPVHAADPAHATYLAEAHLGLAGWHVYGQRPDAAFHEATRAAALCDHLLANAGPDVYTLRVAADAQGTLGNLHRYNHRPVAAVAAMRAAQEFVRRAIRADPENADLRVQLTKTQMNLSPPLLYMGRHDEAAAACRDAIRTAEAALAEYPGTVSLRSMLGCAAMNLGGVEFERGEFAAGTAAFAKAVDVLTPLVAGKHPTGDDRGYLMQSLVGRVECSRRLGEFDTAVADCRRYLALAGPPEMIDARYQLGLSLIDAGRPAEAAAEADHILAGVSPESAERMKAAHLLGACSSARGVSAADADRYAGRAVAVLRGLSPIVVMTRPLPKDRRLTGFRVRPDVKAVLAGRRPEHAPPPRGVAASENPTQPGSD